MELHQIQMVGAQRAQAVFDPGPNVGGRVDVRAALGSARDAATFGREHILIAAMRNVFADQFLAAAVVDRRIDEVDALIQNRTQQHARGLIIERWPGRTAAKLHGTEAQWCDVQTSATQPPLGQLSHYRTSKHLRGA
jgi:hypothetical protein